MQYANKYYSTIVCNVYSSVYCRFKTVHCLLYPFTSWCPWATPLRHSTTAGPWAGWSTSSQRIQGIWMTKKNTSTVFGPDEETRCTEHTFGKLGIWKIPKQHSVTVFFNGAAKTSWIICLSRTNFSIINRAVIVLIISLSRRVCHLKSTSVSWPCV